MASLNLSYTKNSDTASSLSSVLAPYIYYILSGITGIPAQNPAIRRLSMNVVSYLVGPTPFLFSPPFPVPPPPPSALWAPCLPIQPSPPPPPCPPPPLPTRPNPLLVYDRRYLPISPSMFLALAMQIRPSHLYPAFTPLLPPPPLALLN